MGFGVVVDRVITHVNDRFCQMTGYDKSEILGKNARIIYPSDIEYEYVGREKYAQIEETGVGTVETRWKTKDGEILHVLLSSAPIDIENWSKGVTFTVLNITDRIEAERKLRENEERFRSFLDNVEDMVYFQGLDGSLASLNNANESITGFSREEFEDDPQLWRNIVHPDDLRLAEKFFDDHPEGVERFDVDYRLRNRSGEWRWIQSRMVAAHDTDGDIIGYNCIDRDVTEQKRVQEALGNSEEKHRLVVENAAEGIIVTRDQKIIFANPRARELVKYSVEEYLDRPFLRLVHPDDRDMVTRYHKMRLAGEDAPQFYEFRLLDKDGDIRWVSISGVLINWEGKPATLNFINDITERKEFEEKLRVNEERLRTIFDSSPVIIGLLDLKGCWIELNRYAYNILGYESGDLVGRPFLEITHPEERQSAGERFKLLIDGEIDSYNTIRRYLRKDATVFWGNVNVSPLLNSIGEVESYVAIVVDITDKVRANEEIAKAEKLDSIGLLAGGIAHDFNNILSAVLGSVSLARLDLRKDSEPALLLREAEKAIMRARDLTHQLLTFSKGGAPLLKTTSIKEIIRESADFALRGSNVGSRYVFAHDLKPVEADESQLSQVIANLVINADQAMPAGGTIEIFAENTMLNDSDNPHLKKGEYVKISISDSGVGIDSENLSRIFDPFFTTKEKGTGLGLSSCYSIVQKHDGHMGVKSEVGQGTTFYIYLPASTKSSSSSELTLTSNLRGQGRILVMDDEEPVLKLARMALLRLGYDVEAVTDGATAVTAYKKAMEEGNSFDAVIMDLTIPGGVGGKETLARIRRIDPLVKAIVSSGYSNDPVMADYESYGFCGRVAKPYKVRELAEVVGSVLVSESV